VSESGKFYHHYPYFWFTTQGEWVDLSVPRLAYVGEGEGDGARGANVWFSHRAIKGGGDGKLEPFFRGHLQRLKSDSLLRDIQIGETSHLKVDGVEARLLFFTCKVATPQGDLEEHKSAQVYFLERGLEFVITLSAKLTHFDAAYPAFESMVAAIRLRRPGV